ncbi:iron chaperone [Solicola gregarius]|uniref:DUF1801 domain-containing protein n=1 Tax=Solicola gregarius TaxID=2908642 RepID=A0AA46YKR0_9ACTN|nr:DUF1801 domain-containing protein [Solicola gregarius]UYM04751.1 DUF1801 domain-containing protein [Solicola gregarius]
MATTRKSATNTGTDSDGFTAEERAAMKERAQELRPTKRRGSKKVDGETALLEKIAEMPPADRAIAERIHAIVTEAAPELEAKTWYGMPAYAKNGKVVCFFQSADKFKARYATLGFNDPANLDDGTMWPTSFAVTKLTAADEKKVGALVRKAVG